MITASEPLEFIPRGRQAVEEHPGPMVIKKPPTIPADFMLLQRMQNVNISLDDSTSPEFYVIREIYNETPDCPTFLFEGNINTEEELYVKGNTAVWTKGIIASSDDAAPHICLTCESPIKYAFFCSKNFIQPQPDVEVKKSKARKQKPTSDDDKVGVCLLDSSYLKVYCGNGENYVASIECPISKVWKTRLGILLEKEPSHTIIVSHSISMPRLFSLSHPLDEMCPVLIRMNSNTGYLTEADYKLIFTSDESDLVLMFDNKTGKHFVCKLRKASADEMAAVGCGNESHTNTSVFNMTTHHPGPHNMTPQSLYKNSLLARHSTSTQKTSHANTLNSPFSEKHMSTNIGSSNSTLNRSHQLSRLQSTLGCSVSLQDVRKIGQAEPSKPIVPELCLDHLWTDNLSTWKEFQEVASVGFLHTDLIGQTYLCYLLNRSYKLNMARIEKINESSAQIAGMVPYTIAAKDAIPMKRMNMIMILAPCGTLMLYSGPVLVGKVHVAGILSSFVTSSALSCSFGSSFPRRSSLLPSASARQDSNFDDELHMLSPVQPLQSSTPSRLNNCQEIRDPAGNRVTLVFSSDKMFRISLPLICESQLVSRCLYALRQILPKDTAVSVLIKWYGTRNAPGSQDFNREKEFEMFKNMLFQLFGRPYPPADAHLNQSKANSSFAEPKKRRKSDNCMGSDADWDFLMSYTNTVQAEVEQQHDSSYNPNGILFLHIPTVLYTLHLVYEDMKMDPLIKNDLKLLAEFLYELSLDLKIEKYRIHYFLDFPHLLHVKSECFVSDSDAGKLINTNLLFDNIPNVFKYICDIIAKSNDVVHMPYPHIENINDVSRDIILIVAYLYRTKSLNEWVKKHVKNIIKSSHISQQSIGDVDKMTANIIIKILLERNLTRLHIERMPIAVHYLLSQYLETCRNKPLNCYDADVYELLLRPELYAHATYTPQDINTRARNLNQIMIQDHSLSLRRKIQTEVIPKSEAKVEENGMEYIDTKLLRLRFPDDLRINDVKTFLNSSQPVAIENVQAANVSDHEFIDEQEKQLYAFCTRTMSLPIGRGMLTLRTSKPTSTQSLPIPKLCLTGKEVHRGATIEIQQIEVPTNMNTWPMFHNGVAAGLRICPNSTDIDSTWITYNKPKGTAERDALMVEHAGFLMALGLNGHLKTLSFMSIYEYLVKCDEMTSLGLLMGISATYRGTMDTKTTKLLSVHIEALLPPTAVELDIPQNIQVASLMGIGLVYQGTAKRHIAEVLLQEIGRPPGPEMENYVERESYALTAGLALGLVTLEQGEKSTALRDLAIPDTLHYYMVGGNKRPLVGAQKEKYKLPSFQIKEGDTVNIDVTAPGATLALGLMYFRTNNEAIANWMKPPDTTYLLDFIRPDLLLLRIVARNLILWDRIESSCDWVYQQVPFSLTDIIKNRSKEDEQFQTMDYEAQCQAYCNIICGAAICIGLRYAGTSDSNAFETLNHILSYFLKINGQQIGEFAGKQTVENCSIMTLLALCLTHAGTGDIRILRCIRMLRSRIGPSHSHVTYGSHMAIHMSLGFLFLGAGRYTLSRSPPAIAALVCSIFPKFPTHSNDNRYHLQAFRHLYVLAIEPRLFLPRDIDTGKLCLCEICYIEKGKTEVVKIMAPCMLPELDTLQRVYINDPNYWFICFDKDNWSLLQNILTTSGCIDIKQRAGCLSYLEDPNKLKSMLTQTLTREKYNSWKIDAKNLLTFSTDHKVTNLTLKFLLTSLQNEIDAIDPMSDEEKDIIQMLILQTYNCLTHDKMHGLPIYMSLMNTIKNMDTIASPDLWQFKILQAILDRKKAIIESDLLISPDILQSLLNQMKTKMDEMMAENGHILEKYILSNNDLSDFSEMCASSMRKLVKSVTFFDLPFNTIDSNMLEHIKQLDYLQLVFGSMEYHLDAHVIHSISNILNINSM